MSLGREMRKKMQQAVNTKTSPPPHKIRSLILPDHVEMSLIRCACLTVTIHQLILFDSIFSLPVLVQCFRDSGQPCPVSDLFQQFERGKEFNAVGREFAQPYQKLEQIRRHQNRHAVGSSSPRLPAGFRARRATFLLAASNRLWKAHH